MPALRAEVGRVTRRRAAVYATLVAVGWWRWHAQHGRWFTPESVILHVAYDRRR